jgi:hypothetical protein
MTTLGKLSGVLLVALVGAGMAPFGARAAEPAEEPAAAEPAPAAGLCVELGFKSAYMFRGSNLFSLDEVGAQRPVALPLVSWTIGDTGLSLTYAGAFQLSDEGRDANRDGALDLEQDLILGYNLALGAGFSLQAAFTWLVWPFADQEIMDTGMPSVIEPLVGITWSGAVDLGLRVSYFHGVQASLDFLRYAYVNPWLAKRLQLSPDVALVVGLGVGIKAWVNEDTNNMVDVQASIELPINLPNGFYLRPGVYFSWTNLDDLEDGTSFAFRDEVSAWGGLALGVLL